MGDSAASLEVPNARAASRVTASSAVMLAVLMGEWNKGWCTSTTNRCAQDQSRTKVTFKSTR
jgi:hypothetical protein